MHDFYKRFLFKTIDMLGKIQPLPDFTLTQEEIKNLTLFSLKEYHSLFKKYSCQHVKESVLVFCPCFSSYQIYVRNKALLLLKEIKEVESTIKMDEFLLFLEGTVKKSAKCFKKAVEKNDHFWEAYDFLEEIPNTKSQTGNKLLGLHKLRKGISLEEDLLPFFQEFPSFLGAFYYQKKEFNTALVYFEKSFFENEEISFLDLYSNILYLKKETKIGILAYKALLINKLRPETQVALANYYSFKKDHYKSVKYFLNAIKLSNKFTICYTLIGHEFMEIKNYQEAIRNYTLSIKLNKDYRAWFGLGQAYVALRIFQYALVFFKMSVSLKPNDSFLWLTFGNCYSKLKKDDCAKCYLKAYSLGDKEGLIYLADYYKGLKKYSDSVKYYEKYVNDGGKDSKRILEFLVEYYGRIGNKKKFLLYKEKMKETS